MADQEVKHVLYLLDLFPDIDRPAIQTVLRETGWQIHLAIDKLLQTSSWSEDLTRSLSASSEGDGPSSSRSSASSTRSSEFDDIPVSQIPVSQILSHAELTLNNSVNSANASLPAAPIDAIPPEVRLYQKQAQVKLAKAVEAQAKQNMSFYLEMVNQIDPGYSGIREKVKGFYSCNRGNCAVDVKEVWRVCCPSNQVAYHNKSLGLEIVPGELELFRAVKFTERDVSSSDKLYSLLLDPDNGLMYDLYNRAKLDAVGHFTVAVCQVMLGETLMCERMDHQKSFGTPKKYNVCYKNQIMINHLAKVQVSRTSPYPDVPEILISHQDGVLEFNLKTFDFRNASNPYTTAIMTATSLYNGDCIRRQTLKEHRAFKADIVRLGIVICNEHWKKYDVNRQKLLDSGETLNEIWGYHATAPTNVDSIVAKNLDPNRHPVHGRAYGDGCYFSEYPEFSARYNKECMFIFKMMLLPGKFRRHKPDKQGYCEQIILTDSSLFKPVYVLYFY